MANNVAGVEMVVKMEMSSQAIIMKYGVAKIDR